MNSSSTSTSVEESTSISSDDKPEITKFPINTKSKPNIPDDNEISKEEEEDEDENQKKDEIARSEKSESHLKRASSKKLLKRMLMPLIYQMNESKLEDVCGTVIGQSEMDFHPEIASVKLRKALNGLETTDRVVIEVTINHNNFQRQGIKNAYENMYAKRLTDDLEEEFGGYFLDTLLALYLPAHVYCANLLHQSVNIHHLDRNVAVEIVCTRTAMQMKAINDAYQATFHSTLQQDVKSKVEGNFGKMLYLLVGSSFDEQSCQINNELVLKHAEMIKKAQSGIEEVSHNVALFEEIFIGHSWKHIAAVIDHLDTQLRVQNGRTMELEIKHNKKIHNDIRNMLLTIIKVSQNAQLYFAEKLYEAVIGLQLNHAAIIRIIVSRSEIDLSNICDEYRRRYKRRLISDLQKKCGGEYYRLIAALLSTES